jgi:hypothetical protein
MRKSAALREGERGAVKQEIQPAQAEATVAPLAACGESSQDDWEWA